MANTLLPFDERNLTPDEVEALDRRRRRGQLYLVLCFQCAIVATVMLIWTGQDLTYSPGLAHPMFYWNAVTGGASIIFGLMGLNARRGWNEFLSY